MVFQLIWSNLTLDDIESQIKDIISWLFFINEAYYV